MSVSGGLGALCRVAKKLGFLKHVQSGRSRMERRFMHHFATGEGLVEFAVLTESIEAAVADARERGLDLEGPVSGSRTQPDGSKLRFFWGIPRDGLPFFIADETPRHLRVPAGTAIQHPNGVEGIGRIDVAVDDLDRYIRDYEALLGIRARARRRSDRKQERGLSPGDFDRPFGATRSGG